MDIRGQDRLRNRSLLAACLASPSFSVGQPVDNIVDNAQAGPPHSWQRLSAVPSGPTGASFPEMTGFDAGASDIAQSGEAVTVPIMFSEAPGSSSPATDSLSRFTSGPPFSPEDVVDLSVEPRGLKACAVMAVLCWCRRSSLPEIFIPFACDRC